jgi:hypothetical protein
MVEIMKTGPHRKHEDPYVIRDEYHNATFFVVKFGSYEFVEIKNN